MNMSKPRLLDYGRRLEPHPFAELAPSISGEMAMQLHADIAINGLQEPIVLFQGMILDGRSRYNAALGHADVYVVDFEGTDEQALGFVLSKNLSRRHLNASQRAWFAAKALEAIEANPDIYSDAEKQRQTQKLMQDFISRPQIDPLQVWPPKQGFDRGAPETLRAFARSHGVQNQALVPVGDDGEEDHQKAEEMLAAAVEEDASLGALTVEKPAAGVVDWEPRKRGRPLLPEEQKKARPKSNLVAAKTVRRRGIPEVGEAVETGKLRVKKAARIAVLPKEDQPAALEEVLKPTKPAVRTKRVDDLVELLRDVREDVGAFVERNDAGEVTALIRLLSAFCGELVLAASERAKNAA